MLPTPDAIVSAAEREWNRWGRSTSNVITGEQYVGHRDDDPQFAQYIIDSYCGIAGGSPSLFQIQNDDYYWSAVGMSAIMHEAGFMKSDFPFAESHSKFIRHFIAARNNGDLTAAFWGYRHGEPGGEPEPGDLVAYARGDNKTKHKAAALFDSTKRYDSHTDVVVANRGDEIEVIGCNVLDSVTRKTLRLGPDGHIDDDHQYWFAVLKRRSVGP